MRRFLLKTLAFFAVFIALTEFVGRAFVDSDYFQRINSYLFRTENPSTILPQVLSEVAGADFLFIGSSRVAAAINPDVLMNLDWGSTAIVAGRGYLTSGIHYQALKKRTSENPDYLNGTRVLLELPGPTVYEERFSRARMKVHEGSGGSQAHLILPHLDLSDIPAFLMYSRNTLPVKLDVVFLYVSSTRRSVGVIRENMQKKRSRVVGGNPGTRISSTGGIRNDRLALAREVARTWVQQSLESQAERPPLSKDDLDSSMLAMVHRLVVENGGNFCLFKMPAHSVFLRVYETDHALHDREVFESWADERGIPIIEVHDFEFSDDDFPDFWHLRSARRDEFTEGVFREIRAGSSVQ